MSFINKNFKRFISQDKDTQLSKIKKVKKANLARRTLIRVRVTLKSSSELRERDFIA